MSHMSHPAPPPARLSARQAVLWGLAFAIIAVLVAFYFLYGRQLRPLLG